jgi:hypothetical protein
MLLSGLRGNLEAFTISALSHLSTAAGVLGRPQPNPTAGWSLMAGGADAAPVPSQQRAAEPCARPTMRQ